MKIMIYSFLALWLLLGFTASSQLVDSVWVNRVEGPPGALVPMEVWLQWPRDSLATFEVKLTWDASVCTVEAATMSPFPGYLSASNIDNSVPFAQLGGAHLFGDYIGSGNHLVYTVDFRILDTATSPGSTYVDTVEAPMLCDPLLNIYYAAYGGNYLVVSPQLVDSVWVNRVEGPPGALVPMEVWLQWPRDSLATFEVKLTWDASVCTVEAATMSPFPGYLSASNIDNSVPFAHLGGAHLFGDYIGSGNHLVYTVDFRILDTATSPGSTYVDTVEAPMLCDPLLNIYYAAYGGNYLVVSSTFIRGDANGSGTLTLGDGLRCFRCQFVPGWSDSCRCDDATDADDNGAISIGDCLRILRKQFVPGWQDSIPPPCCTAPGDCGADPTPDGLGCEEHPCMGGVSGTTATQNLVGDKLIQERK